MVAKNTSLLERFFCWWGQRILRFAWLVVLLFVVLTGFSLDYTVKNLGVNTDTSKLLSPDLPFQINRSRWQKEFPQDADTILFVVESPTPEQTLRAAKKLEQAIKANEQLFEYVYIPDDNAFFNQQKLLYLDLPELKNLSEKLIDAQPFIGHLSENYHLQGLLDILGLALEKQDTDLSMNLDPILTGIDKSIQAMIANQTYVLSWQEILDIQPPGNSNPLQRIVSARPILDFNNIKPLEQAMNFARSVRQAIVAEDPQVRIRMTGKKALEEDEMRVLAEDTVYAGLFALSLVLLVLFFGLHSFRLVICTMLALLIGLSLTAGFATLAVGHLNVLSIAFAILYIGLGVDFAIHICLFFRELKEQGFETVQAIEMSIKDLGFSLTLCALTTSIGFFAFMPTDYQGVSELGLISGGGMFIGLFVSLTLLPALLKIFAFNRFRRSHITKLPDWICALPNRYAKVIRYTSIILAIAATFSLSFVYLDSNPVNLRDQSSESVVTFKELLNTKERSPFKLIALSDSLENAKKLAAKIERLPTVDKAITLENFVADDQEQKLEVIDDLNLVLSTDLDNFNRPLEQSDTIQGLTDLKHSIDIALQNQNTNASEQLLLNLQSHIEQMLETIKASENSDQLYQRLDQAVLGLLPDTMQQLNAGLNATPFELSDLPDQIVRNWLSVSGIYKVVITPKNDLNNTENLTAFANDVKSIDDSVTGLPVSDLAAGKVITKVFIQAFSTALIVIFFVLLIILRNFGNTLLVMWPLLLAGLLTAAVNVLLHNPFNFANIIALPLLMGMGVDSGIHIMHRLHYGLKPGEHLLQTSTARGVFFSSLTTLLSFFSLAFTNHQGIASMGLLLAIGIAFTLICTLIVLPAFSKKAITL